MSHSNLIYDLDQTLTHHKALLSPEFGSLMNVTITIVGEKEKVHVPRNIIEKRCPSLFLDVNMIKKKKEKKGDAGIVSFKKKNHYTGVFIHVPNNITIFR